ncbi:uncharacterized protein PV06_11665 [Exophiala oligosperma]|uniref:Zn(2)-C6 fungal-type domain-containing protein n=1 Tax=Exophiala oligosperma TaxID=215243 RepID=A0A0D2BEY0_9EURO|nr:uncharacterized protein PV06_11665 [Exophiala oligosperma]KIW36032.1 hypothetical protein PV06_11665 [Exophiala oligosperma]
MKPTDNNSGKSRACDGCRLRKVKCHGIPTCTQCTHLNLRCTFTNSVARRTPTIRGTLIAQLRSNRSKDIAVKTPLTQPATRTVAFFFNLLPQFSEFVYPLNPIISPQEMRQAIQTMDSDKEDEALVYAFAAMTINRTRSSWTLHGEVAILITDLIRCSMRAYRAVDFEAANLQTDTLGPLAVTIKRILTCIFLSVCLATLGQLDRSFAILREGITMLQTVDFQRHISHDPSEVAKWQRLYWEVYIRKTLGNVPSILRHSPYSSMRSPCG